MVALGARVAEVELTDPRSLVQAFHGVDGAYLLNPPAETHPDPLRRAMAIADSLAQAIEGSNLPHAVVLSSVAAHRAAGTGLILTAHLNEQRLRAASASVTFLRCAFFLENWSLAIDAALREGRLPCELQALDAAVDLVGAEDVGATAAAILAGETPATAIAELSGPKRLSPNDVAAALSDAAGRPIRAVAVARESCHDSLRRHGLSEAAIDGFVEMYDEFNRGGLEFEGTGMRLFGTQPVERWASSAIERRPTPPVFKEEPWQA